MHVLFVTPYYVPELSLGGPPKKIHSLAKGLVKRGHSVEVVTLGATMRGGSPREDVDGVVVHRLPWIGRGLRQFPLSYAELRNATGRSDLLECFGLYNLLTPIAAFLAKRAHQPFLIEPLGMYPPRARNQLAKNAYHRLFTRRLTRNAAAIVAASTAEAKDLSFVSDPAKIFYRRNGIDFEEFARLPSGEDLRSQWGIREGERIVLYVGRISPIKNLEQLIEAFECAILESRNISDPPRPRTRAKLVLVGPAEPDYERRLRVLVAERQLEDCVVFAGALYEEKQKAAFALADLFVLPSLNESFGNAAGEAVAANVPVLLTDSCGIAPLIHARAGLAVPLGVESIADGLKKMLDPAFSNSVTAEREQVKRELSWDEPIAQTIELYERIIARRRKDLES